MKFLPLIIMGNITCIGFYISLAALLTAVVAAIYTIMTFYLKKGCKVAVQMSRCLVSSTNCEPYVEQIILENRKDKEVTIYNVYVQISDNLYIDLLHQNPKSNSLVKPILLPPFGVRIINLGPPIAYNNGTVKVNNIDDIFNHKWVNIVLSTNYGKVIADNVNIWEPPFRRRGNTKVIYPIRLHYGGSKTYENPSICSNTKFLVTITYPGGTKKYQQLFDDDLRELLCMEQFTEISATDEQIKIAFYEKYKDQLPTGTKLQVEDVQGVIDNWRQNKAFGSETIIL